MKPPPATLSPQQARDFWFGRINYEQRVPQPADLKLDRMLTLLERLGDPQRRLRIIHIAGSKGKGSTSAMLAAILRRAGYRIGLFTSPHLCQVEERIQVDGTPISNDELTALLNAVWQAVADCASPQAKLTPTFFEVATALGFLHFVRRRVDVAVMEVGLGGRFDSTNVCLPEIALITSISLDHTRQLGDRLASIAMEKAGIVKTGVPAISGATAPEPRQVIERICRERRSPLRQLGIDFQYAYEPGEIAAQDAPVLVRPARVQVSTRRRKFPVMPVGLLGEHQAANAAVAVACVERLQEGGWHVPDEALAWGLANVSWPARLEIVRRRPLTVLDCAHNVASAEALVQTLRASFPAGRRRLLVFACSEDKDVAGIFRVLAPEFAHAFLTRYGDNPRSCSPEELRELMKRSGDIPCSLFPNAPAAWQAAKAMAESQDLICITGSVFLAGELRPLLVGETTAAGH
jgi:dihydrofolate synthase/folylpolyglutamate synthase